MKMKKQFRWFSIFDYDKEQEYLRKMHQSGWQFMKVSGFGTYHFVETEPTDVVYQLDYNKEGLANKEEYIKMFTDCGWDYIQDYAGYSYFKKAVADGVAEEIFCDNASRLAMMERVIKGRMTPLLALFFAVLLPQFILNITLYHNYLIAAVYGVILTTYLSVFATCIVKYRKFKNQAK